MTDFACQGSIVRLISEVRCEGTFGKALRCRHKLRHKYSPTKTHQYWTKHHKDHTISHRQQTCQQKCSSGCGAASAAGACSEVQGSATRTFALCAALPRDLRLHFALIHGRATSTVRHGPHSTINPASPRLYTSLHHTNIIRTQCSHHDLHTRPRQH